MIPSMAQPIRGSISISLHQQHLTALASTHRVSRASSVEPTSTTRVTHPHVQSIVPIPHSRFFPSEISMIHIHLDTLLSSIGSFSFLIATLHMDCHASDTAYETQLHAHALAREMNDIQFLDKVIMTSIKEMKKKNNYKT